MNSTGFDSIVSPTGVGGTLRMAGGGKVPKKGALSHPQVAPPHHTIVIMPIMPHPIVGALMHAATLHHARRTGMIR